MKWGRPFAQAALASFRLLPWREGAAKPCEKFTPPGSVPPNPEIAIHHGARVLAITHPDMGGLTLARSCTGDT